VRLSGARSAESKTGQLAISPKSEPAQEGGTLDCGKAVNEMVCTGVPHWFQMNHARKVHLIIGVSKLP